MGKTAGITIEAICAGSLILTLVLYFLGIITLPIVLWGIVIVAIIGMIIGAVMIKFS